jgi:hypothetical protein
MILTFIWRDWFSEQTDGREYRYISCYVCVTENDERKGAREKSLCMSAKECSNCHVLIYEILLCLFV